MIKIGGIKLNFYKFIGINIVRVILLDYANITATSWEALMFAIAMMLISIEGAEQ